MGHCTYTTKWHLVSVIKLKYLHFNHRSLWKKSNKDVKT
jgi:hypothetical protein